MRSPLSFVLKWQLLAAFYLLRAMYCTLHGIFVTVIALARVLFIYYTVYLCNRVSTAISRWKRQFSLDQWSSAMWSLVSIYMGDCLGISGAVDICFRWSFQCTFAWRSLTQAPVSYVNCKDKSTSEQKKIFYFFLLWVVHLWNVCLLALYTPFDKSRAPGVLRQSPNWVVVRLNVS